MIRAILLSSAVLGAMLATGAAGEVLIHEFDVSGSSIFPMPFLVLFEWVFLGISGVVYVVLTELRSDMDHLKWTWVIIGAYVPLIFLSALSIGPIVLISGVLLLAPTLIISFRNRSNFMRYSVFFGIGAIGNLVLLFALITFSNNL